MGLVKFNLSEHLNIKQVNERTGNCVALIERLNFEKFQWAVDFYKKPCFEKDLLLHFRAFLHIVGTFRS